MDPRFPRSTWPAKVCGNKGGPDASIPTSGADDCAILGILLPRLHHLHAAGDHPQRQQLVNDLEGLFHHKPRGEGRDQVIPCRICEIQIFLGYQSRRPITHTRTFHHTSCCWPASVDYLSQLMVAISTVMSVRSSTAKRALGFEPPLQAWNAALIVAYVGGYLFVIRDCLLGREF
jgi:hypothetical protein